MPQAPDPSTSPLQGRDGRRSPFIVGLVAFALTLVGVLATTLASGRPGEVNRLVGGPVPRRIVPRVSVSLDHRPCTPPDVTDDSASIACASSEDDGAARRRAIAASAMVRTREAGRTELPAHAHARALTELLWGSDAGNALDTSISILGRLARRASDAGVLTDLSAAYLVRGERRRSTRDLLAALDAAARAVALTPSTPAPRFNMALALQQLHLNREAESAWARYLHLEREPQWRAEAQQWAARLERRDAMRPSAAWTSEEIEQWASQDAQRARELGMDEWLPSWGRAVIAGDTYRATALLEHIRSLSAGIGHDGDATLRLAIRAIDDASRDFDTRAGLARFHVGYGAAQRHHRRAEYDSAAVRLDTLLAATHVPFALRMWAMQGRAAAAVNRSEHSWHATAMRRSFMRADTHAMPAVRGRARWVLGTTALRAGRHGEALEQFRHAEQEFSRARELRNRAAARYLVGETQLRLGDTNAGLASIHGAVGELQRDAPSVWLHNALYVLSRAVEGEGHPHAARAIANEDVAATAELDSSAVSRALYVLEATLGLARIIPAHRDSVAPLLHAVPALLETIASSAVRSTMESQFSVVRSRSLVSLDPALAIELLDPAIARFRQGNAVRLLPALLVRADARAALHDRRGAIADLEEAALLFDTERAAVTGEWHRAALLTSARGIVERLVMAEAMAGRGERALEYLERWRRSFAAGGIRGEGAGHALRLPTGTTALTHALIGDTLLTWFVGNESVWMYRQRTSADTVRALVVEARMALERQSQEQGRAPLERLYDLLVRPGGDRLRGSTSVVFAADGLLAGIPFAALRDRESGRYLVEDHVVVAATSVRGGMRAPSADTSLPRGARVLLVSDPASMAGTGAPPRLRGAASEASSIAEMYDAVTHLTGARATPARVAALLGGAGVAHFAGHALADPERPERSALLLAAEEGGRDRLTADELEQLDLSRVQLVVLAACESMRPDTGTSAYRGLADALLGAGARAVIGSLWNVDDGLTRELMVRFHRLLSSGRDAAGSLAEAQREMITSNDGRLASPAAWAAFQYTSGGQRHGRQ